MTTYIIGFITCYYALATYSSKYKKIHEQPTKTQWLETAGILGISIIWPIALAVWMRDLKEVK